MGELAVMGRSGDTKTIWDPSKPEEVAAARQQFDTLRKKGYLAFRVRGEKGERDEQIHAFDPFAGRVILAPPMQGGR